MSRLEVLSNTPSGKTAEVIPPAVVADRGFAGNVALVTLGCAKNLVDSEVMLGALKNRGFRLVTEADTADLIVVNTCAFLKSAVEEGVDTILSLAKLKKTGRCRKLIVAGCMVERYREELAASLPEVDRFISTDELLTVADEGSTTEQTLDRARRPYFLYDETMPRIRSTAGHTAFVKVAEGCNRPCAFCIIPKIRGEFRSRPINSIVNESLSLLREGTRELNLVAQDLTAYGSDINGSRGLKSDLPELLQALRSGAQIADPFWVRLLYAYPIGVTEELINLIRSTPYICNYLDLPLQHISGAVLKGMRRPLGERNTRALIEKIRTIAPEIAIRTTFVVGFPGETEEDVRALRDFVAEGHFTHVGVFPYSQEEEADSYSFDNQVPEEVREQRREEIMEAQKTVVERRHNSLVGTEVNVLIDGYHEESDLLLVGRAEWQGPETDGSIIINDMPESLLDQDGGFAEDMFIGRFATVEITESAEYDLVGKLKELK